MKVLVVEDTLEIREILLDGLRLANMSPDFVEDGREADTMLAIAHRDGDHYDCVILDLTLPSMDGLDVLRAMRNRRDTTPVLILSARSGLDERIDGLDAGADDYLAKPFEFPELIARLRALGRRFAHFNGPLPHIGNLTYDARNGGFFISGQSLKLPPRARAILEALFRRSGSVVTKQYLQKLLPGELTSAEAIDIHISRLRKRLQSLGCTANIVTHYGSGYSIERSIPQRLERTG